MKKAPCIIATLLAVCLMSSSAFASLGFFSQEQSVTADAALEWLEKHSPEIMADLVIIRDIAPDIYMEVVEEAAVEIPEGEELRKTDPELFKFFMETDEMEVRSIRLAVQLAVEKNASKQKAMKKEIRSLVSKVFEQRMEQHQLIVEEIERELADLKKAGKIRHQNSNKVIEQRYNYLVDPNSEALEWW